MSEKSRINAYDDLVFPPALKKGMVRLLKKGTFSAQQHVKRALSASDDKQKGTF